MIRLTKDAMQIIEKMSSATGDLGLNMMHQILKNKFAREGEASVITNFDLTKIANECGASLSLKSRDKLANLNLIDSIKTASTDTSSYVKANRVDLGQENIEIGNKQLTEKLASALMQKSNNKALIEISRAGIHNSFAKVGVTNASVEPVIANDHFAVFSAKIPTAAGNMEMIIPTPLNHGKVAEASVFISGKNSVEFNTPNIINYIKEYFGTLPHMRKVASAHEVLAKLSAPYEKKELVVDGTDLKMVSIKNATDHGIYLKPQNDLIEDRDLVKEARDENTAKHGISNAYAALSNDAIEQSLMMSGTKFGVKNASLAREAVETKLKSLNVAHDSISLAGQTDSSLIFATNIHGMSKKARVEIPVEIKDGRVLAPTIFLGGPIPAALNSDQITRFANSQLTQADHNLSDLGRLSYVELHKKMVSAAKNQDYSLAQECMSVIAENHSELLRKTAFQDYMSMTTKISTKPKQQELDQYEQALAEKARSDNSRIAMSDSLIMLYPSLANKKNN